MNLYLRIWLPVSLVAHLLLYLLVRALPAFPTTSSSTSPLNIFMVGTEQPATITKPPPPTVTPPPKPPVRPPLPKVPPPRMPPPRLPEAKSSQLAWNAPQRFINQLPAHDPHQATGGGFPTPLPGNLPKLTPDLSTSRKEGLADRPDTNNTGTNPLDFPRQPHHGSGRPGSGGDFGTATALLPGAPLPGSTDGGSAGSEGGNRSPFPGNGPPGPGDLPAYGLVITSANGAGSPTMERPGKPGGAGDGPDGMMAGVPRRPGNMGTTEPGPTGTSMGLQPGRAPGFGPANGGGTPGNPGYIFGGGSQLANLPDAGAPGGQPRGGDDTDRPGMGGGPGSGIGGEGPRVGKPSYAAAALSGPSPAYPHDAVTENLHGTVKLEVHLDKDAHVVKVELLPHNRKMSSMSSILDNEAKRTVRRWRFRAAMKNGQRVASIVNMEAIFVLGKTPDLHEVH